MRQNVVYLSTARQFIVVLVTEVISCKFYRNSCEKNLLAKFIIKKTKNILTK